MSIDTEALDRAVRIVMPDVIFAMKGGSCRTYRFAIETYYRAVCYEYHRQRALTETDDARN